MSNQKKTAICLICKQDPAAVVTCDLEGCPKNVGGDELLMDAVRIILESGQVSTALLQRKLRIGYTRAARIIDELETSGMIGPFQGEGAPRFINKDKLETAAASGDVDRDQDLDDDRQDEEDLEDEQPAKRPPGGRGKGMYQKALIVLDKEGYGATTLLQRKLKIGYARAARIMDELEARGVVGPHDGLRARSLNTAIMAKELAGDHEIDEGSSKPQHTSKKIAKPDKPQSLSELVFSTNPEIHARRVKVQRMKYVEKQQPKDIAESLGEQLRTIYRDLEAIREETSKFIQERGGLKQHSTDVFTILQAGYDERQRRRWKAYDESSDEAVMRRLLNDIRDDELRHIELLQSMGIIDKVADKLEVNQTSETWSQKLKRMNAERMAAVKENQEAK